MNAAILDPHFLEVWYRRVVRRLSDPEAAGMGAEVPGWFKASLGGLVIYLETNSPARPVALLAIAGVRAQFEYLPPTLREQLEGRPLHEVVPDHLPPDLET